AGAPRPRRRLPDPDEPRGASRRARSRSESPRSRPPASPGSTELPLDVPKMSPNPAGGRGCTAYDVVVNSGYFRTLQVRVGAGRLGVPGELWGALTAPGPPQADPLYLEFFLTVAMEGLSEKYGVELELTGWRVLKNRKFLGSISAQNIRTRTRPHIQELPG
ncbi:PIHD1 protein, partial [Pycnonotus jocosus]|nr:PIHD1 protein [Pycnonotus jocosus]